MPDWDAHKFLSKIVIVSIQLLIVIVQTHVKYSLEFNQYSTFAAVLFIIEISQLSQKYHSSQTNSQISGSGQPVS